MTELVVNSKLDMEDVGLIDNNLDRAILQMLLDSREDGGGIEMVRVPPFDSKKRVERLDILDSVALDLIEKSGG
ncbi:hypothetical protein IBTHAUMO2_590064 [Nitrosopumilaceae archaeon]|nr:hypothetical protein [Nitrosopumilus sp.]CAI9832123.1 hypothetical protein IBTHAUMO2_590064 [Nitrosopumilaceae archaeon]MDA7945073.1 hypothetical protein [Nitrosopumilus sp.]MDA7954460.1 hypothetical protein [Nitrosopumilus sp.]MDA7973583.1 hypothetical protein [Nitrosopumilus sp.]